MSKQYNYNKLYLMWKDTEDFFTKKNNKKFCIRGNNISADYIDHVVKTKYLKKLDYYQISFL